MRTTKMLFMAIIAISMLGCGQKKSVEEYFVMGKDSLNVGNYLSAVESFKKVVEVESVKIAEQSIDALCMDISASSYPKITYANATIQNQLNEIFKDSYNSYLNKVKADAQLNMNDLKKEALARGTRLEDEIAEEGRCICYNGEVGADFEILTNKGNILSIVQYFSLSGIGCGSNHSHTSVITTYDFQKQILLTSKDFRMSTTKINLINSQLRRYFRALFPDVLDESCGMITGGENFYNLQFGVRNDSIVLAREVYPESHASYATYIIPIEKWKNNASNNVIESDKAEILKLVRRVVPSGVDLAVFPSPIANKANTRYIGFNLAEHKENMNNLKKSNLFASEFINNLDKIVLSADKNLRDGEDWFVDEIGYFNDFDPWCGCQDRPDGDDIEIKILDMDSQKAILTWTWPETEGYGTSSSSTVKVVKENGIWKIAYLQGFDFGD